MDDTVFSVSVESLDRHWESQTVNHLDIIHEILMKSISIDIRNIYAINRNQVKELAKHHGLEKVGSLLNMMSLMFYRLEIIDITCKKVVILIV